MEESYWGGGGGTQKVPVQRRVPFIRNVWDVGGELGRRLKHRVFGEEYLSLSSRVRFHGDNVTVICNCLLVSRQKTGR